jgi:putative hydrolase of the HAD superfamily
MKNPDEILAILFDMNGTLCQRVPDPAAQLVAANRVVELLGIRTSEARWEEWIRNQKAYSRWAQMNLIQLSEAEIWTRWILPDCPLENLESVAPELTLAWLECKGRIQPKPEAGNTLAELKQRGYRLGLISNSLSTLEIPRNLKTFGWEDYFEVVILSSTEKCRKPAPQPFLAAARSLNVVPDKCAYIGNRLLKDIAGCRLAGYGLGIICGKTGEEVAANHGEDIEPDIHVDSLLDLLDLFQSRVKKSEPAE